MNPAILALIGPIKELISEFIPDADKQNELAHEIATKATDQAHAISMAQLAVNQQEAAHRTIWVAGWRPFIGWVCGCGLAMNFLVIPLMPLFTDVVIEPLDLATMLPVLGGLLGLGTLRSYEKVKGISK